MTVLVAERTPMSRFPSNFDVVPAEHRGLLAIVWAHDITNTEPLAWQTLLSVTLRVAEPQRAALGFDALLSKPAPGLTVSRVVGDLLNTDMFEIEGEGFRLTQQAREVLTSWNGAFQRYVDAANEALRQP